MERLLAIRNEISEELVRYKRAAGTAECWSGVTVVLQWCCSGVTELSHWCHSDATREQKVLQSFESNSHCSRMILYEYFTITLHTLYEYSSNTLETLYKHLYNNMQTLAQDWRERRMRGRPLMMTPPLWPLPTL
jgi:hypothetical protein